MLLTELAPDGADIVWFEMKELFTRPRLSGWAGVETATS